MLLGYPVHSASTDKWVLGYERHLPHPSGGDDGRNVTTLRCRRTSSRTDWISKHSSRLSNTWNAVEARKACTRETAIVWCTPTFLGAAEMQGRRV